MAYVHCTCNDCLERSLYSFVYTYLYIYIHTYINVVASYKMAKREEYDDYDIIEESQEAQVATPLPAPQKVCLHL